MKSYIEFLVEIDLPARLLLIRNATNCWLKQSNSTSRLGKSWTGRFIKRNPQFFKKKDKSLSAERKNAHNLEDMRKYFQLYHETIRITPQDLWNMDETGFRIGCGTAHLVVIFFIKQKDCCD